jgi:serine phosphatase RsbU (regulator of sigma subunit)
MQFYLISDGILDQSGGNKGWGFGRKRFTNLVATLAGLPASEQLDIMESELSSYQGDRPQRDDITAVGFRIIQSEKIIEGSKHETQ